MIDSQPLRGLLLRVPLLCGVVMAIEGIDTYGISYIAPYLAGEFSISPRQIGLMFAVTVAASLVGAVGIAPLSDRIGRHKVLLLSTLLVGPPTLLMTFADSLTGILVLRFIIGMGLGAALPTVVALVSEYAPKRLRSLLVMSMSSSIVLGMVLLGIGAGLIIPAFGWRALLYASTAASVLCTLIVWLFIPESPRFLISRRPDAPATRRLLASLTGSAVGPQVEFAFREDATNTLERASPLALVSAPLLARTLLLGLLMTLSYMVINFTVYWLPTLVLREGYDIRDAALVGSSSQAFAVVLSLLVGWLMDRAGAGRVLYVCLMVAAALFAAVAGVTAIPVTALVLLVLAKSFLSTGISGSLAFVAGTYPAAVRATAVGWVLGVARFVGGGVGSLVGGFLGAAGWPYGSIALCIGGVVAVGATALGVVVRVDGRRAGLETASRSQCRPGIP